MRVCVWSNNNDKNKNKVEKKRAAHYIKSASVSANQNKAQQRNHTQNSK